MKGFGDIIGHEEIIGRLRESLKNKNISHAYIFEGEEGSGKKMLSSAFAKALQCEAGYGDSCNMCRSCRQFDSGSHPDIHYVTHEKEGSIGVDEIREQIVKDVSIKPYSSKYKIYIIDEAQKLTEQAQNALLKTIEEPPSYAVIMLLTDNARVLLDTVRSRCVSLMLREVDSERISRYLMEEYAQPDYRARVCSAYSQGKVGKAIEMATSERFSEMNDFVLELMKKVDELDVYEIVMSIRDMSIFKNDIYKLIDLMELWYHDVLILKATNDLNQIVYTDEFRHLSRRAIKSSYEGIQNIMTALDKARQRLRANVNFDTVMELLILTMKEN